MVQRGDRRGAGRAGRAEADEVAPLVLITTTGDRVQDRRLLEIGGKALFTKEIEEALLDGRIDCAVHSLKDMPAELPPGLVIGAIPEREDPRDAFVSRRPPRSTTLPQGARLGTASLRRQAQALAPPAGPAARHDARQRRHAPGQARRGRGRRHRPGRWPA